MTGRILDYIESMEEEEDSPIDEFIYKKPKSKTKNFLVRPQSHHVRSSSQNSVTRKYHYFIFCIDFLFFFFIDFTTLMKLQALIFLKK